MDLVPDDVLSSHILPLLSFRDALRLYSSCGRFRSLLFDRLAPSLDVLRVEGDLYSVTKRAVGDGLLELMEFLIDHRGVWIHSGPYVVQWGMPGDLIEELRGFTVVTTSFPIGWCSMGAGRDEFVERKMQ